MADIQIPVGFTPVEIAVPQDRRPVLAIRVSGYAPVTFEVMTAVYDVDRPLAPWRDLSGDGVGDSGTDIIGWKAADEWLQSNGS